MKKQVQILIVFLVSNKPMAMEPASFISNNELCVSNDKYMSPFPYDVEIQLYNLKCKWTNNTIICNVKDKNKLKYCNKLINAIPDIVYKFQTGFAKNRENYFKYLINNERNYNIINDNFNEIIDINFNKNSKCILEKYYNPFNKNPFLFKINDNKFCWKDAKIFADEYDSIYKKRLNNILIDFNDNSKYFYYLLKKQVELQSLKIDIKYDKNINKNYKSFTFNTKLDNTLDNIVVIKDCVRTYRWHNKTIDIIAPSWLNDNLSRNNYSIFLQLLNRANDNFHQHNKDKNNAQKLEELDYWIRQELGENILVYALKWNNSEWENIDNLHSDFISTVVNNKTGFVEVSHNKSHNKVKKIIDEYDWNNDKDDF